MILPQSRLREGDCQWNRRWCSGFSELVDYFDSCILLLEYVKWILDHLTLALQKVGERGALAPWFMGQN